MSKTSQAVVQSEDQITITKLFRLQLIKISYAYRGKRILFTLLTSLVLAVLGILVTIFAFPSLFSSEPTKNATYSGFAVTLVIMTIMGMILGIQSKGFMWFMEPIKVCVLWSRGIFGRKIMLKERIFTIIFTIVGLTLGCLFSHMFMLLLSVTLFGSALSNDKGQILQVIKAIQNSFSIMFRKGHMYNPEATRRDFAGLAIGMFITSFIFALIGGSLL